MVKKFYKAIVFCSNPLTGFYRFENKFQIYKLTSENAPNNEKIKQFPVVIEYWVEHSDEMQVPELLEDVKEILSKNTHSQNYQKSILSLLSSVTNYRFFFPTAQFQWFTEVPPGAITEDLNKHKSKGGINWFWYPEMHMENVITGFTELEFDKVELVKHPDCFVHLDIDGEEIAKFPEHTDVAIHNYYALDDKARAAVDSATSLICNGIDVRTTMKSLSFISSVSSIETMVNYENRGEEVKRCVECGQPMFRVMAKFRDYLLKYASNNPNTKKEVNDIYQIRSKIVHTGLLLFGDNKIDWSNDEEQNEQWQTHLKVMQISRVSLTNWLLMRGKEQRQKGN